MKQTLFIVLCTWFLGNMAIHLLTPALPGMALQLGISGHWAQMMISLFLLGKSLGVLLWGPLAEVYGRRRFMIGGLALYTLASLVVTYQQHILPILVLRFLQGLGVSATVLMGRTIINDCFGENKAVKAFATLFTLAGVIIAMLPMLGGLLAFYAVWQVSFYVMAAYALLIMLFSLFWLPETAQYSVQKISIKTIFSDYSNVIHHPIFLSYLLISALMVAGESAFNTSAAFIMMQQHNYTTLSYGFVKTILGLAHLFGSAVCVIAIKYVSPSNLTGLGIASFLCASVTMILLNSMGLSLVYVLVLPMIIYYFGTGFIVATVSAAVVRPFPKKMATAMGFCLFLQFLISSIFSFISSLFNIQTVFPLGMMLIMISTFSMLLWLNIVVLSDNSSMIKSES